MRHLIVGGALCSIWLFARAGTYSAQKPETVTVTGTLVQVASIGGETTGWAIHLDTEMKINGTSTRSIEVAGPVKEFARLQDKHVKATGPIRMRHGVERGDWPVLQVDSIEVH